jgi:hypothetical protein
MQKPSVNVDATYRRVCMEKVSNVIGKKEDWIDSAIYVTDGPHQPNRCKITIHSVYLSSNVYGTT